MQDGIRGGISHPCFTQTVYKITGRLLPPHGVVIAIAIDPHRRRATNGNGHNEQIKQRDHRKQAGLSTKLHIGDFACAQGGAHLFKRHFVVIEGVITILDG